MFATKTAVFIALFTALAHVATAQGTPACLIAAINTESNPSDLQTICGTDASKVQMQIQGQCGNNGDAALKAFASVCAGAGKTVPSISSTASDSGSTVTGSATETITSGPSQTATGTATSGFTALTTGTGASASAATASATGASSTASSSATISAKPTSGAVSKYQIGSYVAIFAAGAVGVLAAF